jgi:hypothetical protein
VAWLDVLRSTPGLSEADIERYGTKPLLILVEAYVLDCIGELGSDRSALAGQMAARTFGGLPRPDWRTAVRANLGLPSGLDAEVRELWHKNLEEFGHQGLKADPVEFARAFADNNF